MAVDLYRHQSICEALDALGRLCPLGYAAALHLGFHLPAYLFQTYPKAWRDEYCNEGYLLHDPTLEWGARHKGSIRWPDVPGADGNIVMTRAAEIGLHEGFCVAVGSDGERSIFNGARSAPAYTDREIASGEELFANLHELTRDLDTLSEETEAALRVRSIEISLR